VAARDVQSLADRIDDSTRSRIAAALQQFADLLAATGAPFSFSDCSLGNLVFARLYLQSGRAFNRAVDNYTSLVGLPIGLIENVTDGTNAWLVGVDEAGHVLGDRRRDRQCRQAPPRPRHLPDRPSAV
jgi:hypothetical protein